MQSIQLLKYHFHVVWHEKHNFSCHCIRVQNNPITNYFFIWQQPPAVKKASNFCLHFTKGCTCAFTGIHSAWMCLMCQMAVIIGLLQRPGLGFSGLSAVIGKQSQIHFKSSSDLANLTCIGCQLVSGSEHSWGNINIVWSAVNATNIVLLVCWVWIRAELVLNISADVLAGVCCTKRGRERDYWCG